MCVFHLSSYFILFSRYVLTFLPHLTHKPGSVLHACQQGARLVTGCKPISHVQNKMKFTLFMITAFGVLCGLTESEKREPESSHFLVNQVAQKEKQVENHANSLISYLNEILDTDILLTFCYDLGKLLKHSQVLFGYLQMQKANPLRDYVNYNHYAFRPDLARLYCKCSG
jgi:hypothetical protein